MAYAASTVTSSGLTIPSYIDIRDDLVDTYKSIYGDDAYLENDSADYQWISAIALKISDTLKTIQLDYNNRSPVTAVGAALSSLVKINGLTPNSSTYSTATVTLAGTAYAIITNGVAKDLNGYKWDLPASVVLDATGALTSTVTCQDLGAITAQPADISIIDTPTYGWTSITNASAASPGLPVETDSQLRYRQSISTAIASQSPLDATIAAIAAVSGVTRYKVYENDTSSTATDPNGYSLPAHSITAVVEGGADEDIALAISNKKTPGGYTNGDEVVNITGIYGTVTPIRFYRASYVDIDIEITIKTLTGYTSATNAAIIAALAAFLNTPQIGDDLAISSLWYTAMSVNPSISEPLFSITSMTVGKVDDSGGTTDIVIDYDEVLRGDSDYITVVET